MHVNQTKDRVEANGPSEQGRENLVGRRVNCGRLESSCRKQGVDM